MTDKPLILSIDDDPDILDFMQTILQAKGYRVITAPTAEDGLKAFQEHQPALVFVDLMMEEVDAGTAFVKEMRASGASVPIYMLSSLGDVLNQNTDYAALGLKGVLQKPINPEALLNLVKKTIG